MKEKKEINRTEKGKRCGRGGGGVIENVGPRG